MSTILSYSRIFNVMLFLLKNSLCGYQIRMESRTGEATRLLYCTTGVLLRKLQEDGLLSSVSHVIVDEVISSLFSAETIVILGPDLPSLLRSCYMFFFPILGA